MLLARLFGCTKGSPRLCRGQTVNKVRNRQNRKTILTIFTFGESISFCKKFKQIVLKNKEIFIVLTYFGTRSLPYLCTATGASFKGTSDSIHKDGRREIFRQGKVWKTQEY